MNYAIEVLERELNFAKPFVKIIESEGDNNSSGSMNLQIYKSRIDELERAIKILKGENNE